jgi:hypothetical protein
MTDYDDAQDPSGGCPESPRERGATIGEPTLAILIEIHVGPSPRPFVHYCHCGKWGSFGHGVSLLRGVEGTWFCGEHRPRET